MDIAERFQDWLHNPIALLLMLGLVLAWLPYGRIRRWWNARKPR